MFFCFGFFRFVDKSDSFKGVNAPQIPRVSLSFPDDFFGDEGLVLVEGVALSEGSVDGDLFGAISHQNTLSYTGEMIIFLLRIQVFEDLDG